jgi:hypothetical protein
MVHKELTCQILVQLRKYYKSRRKNLGVYNQLARQGIYSRFRAPLHVGTFGTKQFRVTSCRVLLLRTPKKMSCTYQIWILSCVKTLEDGRRRGLGTTWMKQKLELQ